MFRLVGCCLNITHKQLLLFLYVMKYYNLENVAKMPMLLPMVKEQLNNALTLLEAKNNL